jgi:hypothetical protein
MAPAAAAACRRARPFSGRFTSSTAPFASRATKAAPRFSGRTARAAFARQGSGDAALCASLAILRPRTIAAGRPLRRADRAPRSISACAKSPARFAGTSDWPSARSFGFASGNGSSTQRAAPARARHWHRRPLRAHRTRSPRSRLPCRRRCRAARASLPLSRKPPPMFMRHDLRARCRLRARA